MWTELQKISPAQGGADFRSVTGSQFSPGSRWAIRIRYLFNLAVYFTACAVHEAGVLTLHFVVLTELHTPDAARFQEGCVFLTCFSIPLLRFRSTSACVMR